MKNKKSILLVIFLSLLIVLLTGCSILTSEQQEPDLSSLKAVTNLVANNEEYTKHTNEEGISFYCPTDWISVGEEGTLFFMSPDLTGTSVNLVNEEIGSLISLKGYIEIAKNTLGEEMNLTSEIEQEAINLNGREAYVISYTAEQNEIEMKVFQEVIKVDEKVPILTAGTITDNYQQVEEILNNILSSFTK